MRPKGTWLFVAGSVSFAVVVLLFKYNHLKIIEPETDQAFFANWALEVSSASHIFPDWRKGVLESIISDPNCFLYKLGYPIYNQTVQIQTLIPLLIASFLCVLLGYSYSLFIGAFVFIHVLTAAFVALTIFQTWNSRGFEQRLALGLVGFALVAGSYYLHWFSSLGVHNLGILIFLLVGTQLNDIKRENTRLTYFPLFCLIGSFSHWTLSLLTSALILVNLAMNSDCHRKHFRKLLWGLFFSWLGPLTAKLLLILISNGNASSAYVYLGFAENGVLAFAHSIFARTGTWFHNAALVFSAPGLILVFAGMMLENFTTTQKQKTVSIAIFSHFVLWIFIPGFSFNGSPTAMRTMPYLIPFFSIGVLKAMANGTELFGSRYKYSFSLVIFTLLFGHTFQQFVGLRHLKEMNPEFNAAYFDQPHKLHNFDRHLNSGKIVGIPVLVWDYDIKVKIVAINPQNRSRLVSSNALGSLEIHALQNALPAHFAKRGMELVLPKEFLLISPSSLSRDALQKSIDNVCVGMDGACKASYHWAELLSLGGHRNDWRLWKVKAADQFSLNQEGVESLYGRIAEE